jgi:hypothetical protein
MNVPVQATVEQFAIHARLEKCIVFKNEELGGGVPAAISRALRFSSPDPV